MQSTADTQVIEAYRRGLKPEEIASSLGYELSAVQFILANKSREFRKGVREGRIEISDDDLDEVVRGIIDMAKSQELLVMAPKVKLAAAIWVAEEAVGRNSARVKMPQITEVNVVQIQEQIERRNQNFDKLLKKVYGNVVDVEQVSRELEDVKAEQRVQEVLKKKGVADAI